MELNLWQQWARLAEQAPDREAICHWQEDRPEVRWRRAELLREATRAAAWLQSRGVRPGAVCALIIRHHPRFYPLYLGVVRLGAIPAVLAPPNARIHPDKYVDGLEGMSRRSGLDWVLTEGDLEPVVGALVSRPGSTVRGLLLPLEGDWPDGPEGSLALPPIDPAAPCLLQHSSGTTGLQKGVVLSHAAVLGHVRAYAEAIDLRPTDRVVSWLPLYHDMGLIAAFHLALALGVPLVQLDPFQWVLAPGLLFEAIAREAGTLAWMPNFAYNLLVDRVHDADLAGLRLDHLRLLINCSEPVRSDSHLRFLARFGAAGVRPGMLGACYAMAETTFAATQTAPGVPPREVRVDREALAQGRVVPDSGPGARICVSSGRPLPGCRLELVAEDGSELGPGRVGEVVIQSPWLFDGYRGHPEATDRVLHGPRYRTGDTGFTLDGEWFIIGRNKDLLIVAGKNLYPEDIEDALLGVAGVLPGRVVAFGLDDAATGTEGVAVLAETGVQGGPARRALRLAIVQAGMAVDVTLIRVFLVPPRWLIKSSAGKPSRNANKQRILDAPRLAEEAAHDL
jgi:acyl-CoA synthetase (AMP-forming)/AMP-acid ligase II